MHEDVCDNCGEIPDWITPTGRCNECGEPVQAEGTFHAELRLVIEQAEGTPLALLVPQAQVLLALPEESVAALVAAAQMMVGAASFGR